MNMKFLDDRVFLMIDHEERLRQLRILDNRLQGVARIHGTAGRVNGKFLDAGDTLYKIISKEARRYVQQWLREKIVERGHINLYREKIVEI